MTSRLVKLYAVAATALGFSVAWAGVAGHPFGATAGTATAPAGSPTTAQVKRLNARARALQRTAERVGRLEAAHRTAQRNAAAAAVQVRTISLPAVTVTRSS